MVSSSSVTRVSMHTAKRDQKQPCFVEYIRHLHVDLYLVDSQIWGVTVHVDPNSAICRECLEHHGLIVLTLLFLCFFRIAPQTRARV